ncbi:sodium-independent sulfate anion transporter-like isoform X3 [Aethina tumida]|uniref:sodium-independent sulfate anion transporter-like isoform X3 n=1 Tax=Aethina tumida TaxID=116153 RepID=UPI002148D2FA|nr:sodium-independent sulfate anion transporter-like isoform X3 [Aethina tumida]
MERETLGLCRSIDPKKFVRSKFPVLEWMPKYTLSTLFHDLLAGLTVGLTEIPQGIAYAVVAGMGTEYGLYSGFMGCFMYFIFGTCKDINIGPTAIMALMMQPHVAKMGDDMAVLMTFIAGVIIFVLGLLNLGFLVQFFSYPVIAGFTSAAALNIASSQIKSLLGIKGKSDAFLEAWETVFKNIRQVRTWDTTLGLITIVFLVLLKEIRVFGTLQYRQDWSKSRNIIGRVIFLVSLSRNALAVIVGIILAYCLENNADDFPFLITGSVKSGLPPFKLPPFTTTFNGTDYSFSDMVSDFNTIVIFCPLIAILEHIAIAKAFSKGRTLDATQELVALGVSNIMGSFVGSMPVTGSFTRTAVNNSSGVKTPAGGILTGTIVLLALGFLTSAFYYIPKATLAAVVIVAMFYLFEFEAFVVLWRSKKLDLLVFLVTLICCLLISLEYGIIIGIIFNLTFVLYTSARPKITIDKEKFSQGDVYVITPKTNLHFTAAEYMRELILQNCDEQNALVVINGRNVGNLDATVAKSFHVLVDEFKIRKQKIVFWKFKERLVNICAGIDPDLVKHFKNEDLEVILTEINSETQPSSVHSIQ